jgi:hypothetical protein
VVSQHSDQPLTRLRQLLGAFLFVLAFGMSLSAPAIAFAKDHNQGKPASSVSPSLAVGPSPFPANVPQLINYSGSGYSPGQTLVVGIGGVVALGQVAADANGNFTFNTTVTLAPASYTAYVMLWLNSSWVAGPIFLFNAQ